MNRIFTENPSGKEYGIFRILVLTPSWLGDAVMSLSFFQKLRGVFPDGYIVAACSDYVSEIYENKTEINQIVTYSKGGLKNKISLIKELRSHARWEICFLLSPSFSSALTAFLSGAKRRIGYGTDSRSLLLTDAIDKTSYKKGHIYDVHSRLIGLARENVNEKEYIPSIEPPGNWKEIIESKGIKGKYAVFSAGASYGPAKLWPAENYLKLSELLRENEGLNVVAVGVSREREYLNSIIGKNNGSGVNLAGECNLKELIAILKGAEVVVGNDSGPVHLSSALGVPTVAIFGSTSPLWTGPRGKRSRIVNSNIKCSPCFKRECPLYDYAKCFDDILTGDVYEVVREVMSAEQD
ncbi:MAG: lipopolysaccharide heptosyltransferase II [Candidatus Krumholzibacteriota bacterium]|nr:lipopolysaccharide heptosyltransferase II [Candidatus Krumholzibacteriota bacterium]